MSAVLASAPAGCTCELIATPGVRLCPTCHKYWRGDQRLTSVSKVIRSVWPVKKNFEAARPEVLEHARERGSRIDRYFSEWLRTGYLRIPRDSEWLEVTVCVRALINWWTTEAALGAVPPPDTGAAEPQVIFAGELEAGTADVRLPKAVIDLKCTSALEETYDIQIGAYADLEGTGAITEGWLLHCKYSAQRNTAKVTPVQVDLPRAIADWRSLRDVWRIAQRREPKKAAAVTDNED